MKVIQVKRKQVIFICAMTMMLFLSGFIPMVQSDDEYSMISVSPGSIQVGTMQTFTVGIQCTPAAPMKSFECRISYDPDLLTVTDIREGDIFQGFDTFFNKGTINNNNGVVTMIYGLILGVGNVTDPGTLVYVDFQAKEALGQTSIHLSNVGITDEEQYLPVTTTDGSCEVLAMLPTIQDVSIEFSDPLDTNPLYGWYQISCDIDDDDIDASYLEVVRPDGTIINESMNQISSSTFSYQLTTFGHGTYQYHVYVVDAQGYTASSSTYSFIIPPNWDVNMDGYASVLDFTCISNKLGSHGPGGFIREDVNNNGLVSISDIVGVSNYYHQYW
jgi:hypothetical protein